MSLKSIRLKKGYSQIEVSKLLNMPLRTYKRYELSEESNKTYRHELIQSKLTKLPTNIIRKDLKNENICVVEINSKSVAFGTLLAKKNKVTFFDENNDVVKSLKSGQYHAIQGDISTFIEENGIVLSATSNENIFNISDLIFLSNNNEIFTRKILQKIFENNKDKVVVISNPSMELIDYTKSQFKGLEVIALLDLSNETKSIFCYKNPKRLVLGVKRISLKSKRVAMILENIVDNATKASFVSFDEFTAISSFISKYLSMHSELLKELKDQTAKMGINTNKVIENVLGSINLNDFTELDKSM
ncbi:MAG: helix-turn-helix transcriptional regulator [Bacilli bacterium]|nr:helix-turn-helix transcriptional regulator [Bacilli bacterium]